MEWGKVVLGVCLCFLSSISVLICNKMFSKLILFYPRQLSSDCPVFISTHKHFHCILSLCPVEGRQGESSTVCIWQPEKVTNIQHYKGIFAPSFPTNCFKNISLTMYATCSVMIIHIDSRNYNKENQFLYDVQVLNHLLYTYVLVFFSNVV